MRRKHFTLAILTICLAYSCKKRSIHLIEQQQLGQYLFFDTRLSLNNTKSCASCHNPSFAFSDGYKTSITALGENVQHNAPSLINSTYLKRFDWANPTATSLVAQIQRPLYGNHPIELGLNHNIQKLNQIFSKDTFYIQLFKKAFPNDNSLFTPKQIETALVAYEKTLISRESKFDKQTFTSNQYYGLKLFTSAKLNCVSCHPPPYFTLATKSDNIDSIYANIGLYVKYPLTDNGLSSFTKKSSDEGKFKIPSLRNVLLTAPYMHDGSIATISEVIDHYAKGGRNHPNKNKNIKGFTITSKEKQDLIEFLETLTDSSIFYKQNFKNPFKSQYKN